MAESTTVPVRPLMLVSVIVTVVDDPAVSVVLLGLDVIPKSEGPARGEAECGGSWFPGAYGLFWERAGAVMTSTAARITSPSVSLCRRNFRVTLLRGSR